MENEELLETAVTENGETPTEPTESAEPIEQIEPIEPAGSAEAEKKPFSLAEWVYDWAETLIFALIFVTVVFSFMFRIVGVDGDSMMDTLMSGDRLILRSMCYMPDYGDIVVIYRDEDKEPLIKRVIGMAGDTIRVDVENNTVYRNGVALDEPYVNYPLFRGIDWDEDGEVTVPEGHLFVMGDHRNLSKDSRSAEIQMVDTQCVMGEAVFRIFPFNQIGII